MPAHHWPPNQNGKKVTATQIKRDTTVADLRRELLKNENGFKTTRPRRSTTVAMQPPPPAIGTQAISSTGSETMSIQEPTGGGAGLFPKGQPVLLYVFVRDLRPQYQNTKGQAAMIIVDCATNPINNKPFLASGADVLREVQKTNAAIQALGYGRTTLKTAVGGFQIVKDYGRSGNTPIESVVAEVERTDAPQKGATALYNFLRASV
ncbi:hypothetical protein PM082_009849 [Marasmius tenuissimus]|nr:hypothetical protein PM082_009849 [Marasmius tenuissimus]